MQYASWIHHPTPVRPLSAAWLRGPPPPYRPRTPDREDGVVEGWEEVPNPLYIDPDDEREEDEEKEKDEDEDKVEEEEEEEEEDAERYEEMFGGALGSHYPTNPGRMSQQQNRSSIDGWSPSRFQSGTGV
jgi:hypothetical protein